MAVTGTRDHSAQCPPRGSLTVPVGGAGDGRSQAQGGVGHLVEEGVVVDLLKGLPPRPQAPHDDAKAVAVHLRGRQEKKKRKSCCFSTANNHAWSWGISHKKSEVQGTPRWPAAALTFSVTRSGVRMTSGAVQGRVPRCELTPLT